MNFFDAQLLTTMEKVYKLTETAICQTNTSDKFLHATNKINRITHARLRYSKLMKTHNNAIFIMGIINQLRCIELLHKLC
jgi:benzoyl-CoA reductase/2-hydroxyglutaryl-CoA dehydratase subunit BcrC/BadD/HgdB